MAQNGSDQGGLFFCFPHPARLRPDQQTFQERWATFTQYPIVQHTEASSEREMYAELGAVEATAGGGMRQQSSAVGGVLASAGEIITTKKGEKWDV